MKWNSIFFSTFDKFFLQIFLTMKIWLFYYPEKRERGGGRGSFFTRIRLGRRWIWRIEKIQPRERDTLAGFHPSPSIWYKGYQRLRNPSEKFLNPSSASRSRDKLITGIPEKSRKFILPGVRVSFVKIYERTNNEKKKKRKGRIKSANWRPRSSLEPGKRGSKFRNETKRNERAYRKVFERCLVCKSICCERLFDLKFTRFYFILFLLLLLSPPFSKFQQILRRVKRQYRISHFSKKKKIPPPRRASKSNLISKKKKKKTTNLKPPSPPPPPTKLSKAKRRKEKKETKKKKLPRAQPQQRHLCNRLYVYTHTYVIKNKKKKKKEKNPEINKNP